MFAYQLGLKLIAAKGKVVVQAQSDAMELDALKDLMIRSVDGKVIITASKEVWIGAGGSYIQINGSGIINGSPGPILEKGASWDVPGADSNVVALPNLPRFPERLFDRAVQVVDYHGNPIKNRPVRVHLKNGYIVDGKTDSDGLTSLAIGEKADVLKVEILKKLSGKNV